VKTDKSNENRKETMAFIPTIVHYFFDTAITLLTNESLIARAFALAVAVVMSPSILTVQLATVESV
jgi:hypothetical protein